MSTTISAAETSDEDLKYESLGVARSAIVLLFVVVGLWYLHWRFPTLAPDAPFLAGLLYAAEIYGFISALLHLLMTWRLTIREAPAPEPGLSVDVFIPTYNESVDIVRKTVLAARQMDYAHETWLLDDGHRAEMKALAERLGVRYLAREKNLHAKAGNLNNALAHSHGQFIAIFDADHAPQRNFLTRTLGYFKDSNVGFVQTPQDFFNLDSYQHRLKTRKKRLWTEQSLFFKVIQRGKDYWNAAFFCGSCAVVRRSALTEIGGIATDTITEDLHTSIRLHKAGYRSVYHAESLAYGIAPANVVPFLKQRVRWGQGAMQVLRKEGILFDRRLTLVQKLNYLASMLTYFDGWQKGIFYVLPAVVLLTGILPIQASGDEFLLHFIPYYLLNFIVFEEVGRGYGGTLYIEQYNFARFAAFAWATLTIFGGKREFMVTNKGRGPQQGTRRFFLPQTLVLWLNLSAIPLGLLLSHTVYQLPFSALVFNLLWAAVNGGLALMMFSFTKKTQKFLRDEYRFPVPLPVTVHTGQGDVRGTIDNVSATGCRIYARLPDVARRGTSLQGEIQLPSGPLPFTADIMSEITGRAGEQVYVKAVGCKFRWQLPEHQDALELFLYGTDLQSKLLALRSFVTTPIQWLRRGRSAFLRPLSQGADEHWVVCELLHLSSEQNAPLQPGLLPLPVNGEAPQLLVSFQPLMEAAEVKAWIYTRTRRIGMRATIGPGERMENSAGPVYIHALKDCRTADPEAPHHAAGLA